MTNESHIRIGVVRAGKRINDSRGNPGQTLCGAPVTANDCTIADARKLRPETIDQFHVCQMCLARIPVVR